MMIEPIVKDLLEAGVHFGHQTHRWNPKMKRFIFGEKNGIYILDLEKTVRGLTQAQDFLRLAAAQGGPILFVGTKRQAQPIIEEEALRCGQFYVNLRWLGGLLTNFETVRKSIVRLKTIRGWKEDGTMDRMKKKEAAQADKEMVKLEKVLRGIQDMPRLPKAIYLVDAKREETAIQEATRLSIPVVGLVDTNSNPDPIQYVIPGNDDAIRSIKMVTHLIADAILEGHQSYLAGVAAEASKKKAEAAAKAEEEERATREKEVPPPAVEEAAAATDLPEPVDEVEKIIPDAALKTKVEVDELPKKKRIPKVKAAQKEPEKEPPPHA